MKKLKVGMLALSVLAGGLTFATAASTPETFSQYEVYMDWQNTTNQNDVTSTALLFLPNRSVSTPLGTFPQLTSFVDLRTDGSGKITGSGYLTIRYSSNALPASYFQVDVTGNVTGKDGANTKVKLSIKGTGYSDNDDV